MKTRIAVWSVIVALSSGCHEAPPTGPDMFASIARDAGIPVAGIRQVSAGPLHGCALDSDRTVTCWGRDRYGQSTPVEGKYSQVAAGWEHTCALEQGGTIVCWGANYAGEAAPPNGSFSEVGAGDGLSCGLRRDGSVVCWGHSDEAQQTTVPEGRYAQVTVGPNYACALRRDATAVCWGWAPGSGQPTGEFAQLDAGTAHACGVRLDGTLSCWGSDAWGQSTAPAGVFTKVSAGWSHSCAVAVDGSVACWGDDDAGQSTPPAGPFTDVSAGWDYTCGIRRDRTLVCWGETPAYEAPVVTLEPVSAWGSGTITDAAGRELHFGFNLTLDPERGSAPDGSLRFRVPDSGITLTSTVIYTMELSGDAVIVRGAGVADLGPYERPVEFVVTAVDGGAAAGDAFRAQIWTDEFNALEYDSGTDALPTDAGTPLDHGTVRIRTN